MNQKLYIKDIMTVDPVAVGPEDSVVYAARILFEHNFNGLPVVNEQKEVVGILTEYDLISKGGDLHMSTLINVLGNLDTYKKDNSLVKDELKRLLILKVKDVMNIDPLVVQEGDLIQILAEIFAKHHRVNPVPVLDKNKKLVGVVSRFDLVKFFVAENAANQVDPGQPAVLDQKVAEFIGNFEKKILFHSTHTGLWSFLGFVVALVGISIGLALILKFLA
ncbi:MAG: hypothetical protein A3C71_01020 [Candidatus Yanofskybacteria bacterium RIFCSPHIGHO2_02_FULL_43_15c]|uniref:CBS domain-containing protein n=1 Tax=Candidatus Yanofskybacteria bacterium RIFCSPHIGHO2_02_FULL_43_15c TaxID=1802679 RepID=A0A1F8FID8_9BACT|nr:MAG: hypothetical protein A3C71_01020 [Candidatus Yanofskybacteria bacterium RIFCSPHIGHO2_02_FULL_43_15c]